ncbi:MAG: hypothetical protein CFE46_11465 [Burkholderiales bacterium PBB6]|nr:MAG: hypothetical protein CFE46_11465 [Burkholderiales bacterium PBB6]
MWSRFMTFALPISFAFSLLLAGCGGGGSSGDQASNVTLANVSLPAITDETYENGSPTRTTLPSFLVSADVQGNLASLNGKTIYVIVEDRDGFVQRASVVAPLRQVGTTIYVETKTFGPPPGRYTSGFVIKVCLDSNCTTQLGGSPIVVPYDITVLPGLVLNSNAAVSLTSRVNTRTERTVPLTLPTGLLYYPDDFLPYAGKPRLDKQDIPFQPALDWRVDSSSSPTATVIGNAAAAGSYSDNLVLYAEVQTPKGKRFRLEAQVPVLYTVTP